jgi:hypothetical protein
MRKGFGDTSEEELLEMGLHGPDSSGSGGTAARHPPTVCQHSLSRRPGFGPLRELVGSIQDLSLIVEDSEFINSGAFENRLRPIQIARL